MGDQNGAANANGANVVAEMLHWQNIPVLVGTILLVAAIVWWIWKMSADDSAGSAPGREQASSVGFAAPAVKHQESTTTAARPVMPSAQQNAEQRAARLARFTTPNAASSQEY